MEEYNAEIINLSHENYVADLLLYISKADAPHWSEIRAEMIGETAGKPKKPEETQEQIKERLLNKWEHDFGGT